MSDKAAPVVVLMTSNGAGMGHLARQGAVAAAATAEPAQFAPVLFSMSTALPTVAAASGLPGEYCPGPTSGWMPVERWHEYLQRRLVALVTEVGATALVFDGTSPYPGLLAARRELPDLQLVWSRRGMWRSDASRAPLRAARYFDLVVEPGDLAEPADRGPTAALLGATRVGPVTLLETEPLLDRAAASSALGLHPDRPTLLVTLGAGNINDPAAAMTVAVRTALADPDWQVALTRAPIAWREAPAELAARVTVLSGVYPLVRYLAAFDAAVSAAGYNGVHELVLGGLPTLLVANPATSADDQEARAAYLAGRGWALSAGEADVAGVRSGVAELLTGPGRDRLRAATADLPPPDGAAAVAAAVGALAAHPVRRALARDPYQPLRTASVLLRRSVGEAGWERARRLRGAPPRRLGAGPLPVRETSEAVPEGVRRLVVTSDLGVLADLSLAGPSGAGVVVEHVLAGSSAGYLIQRRAIAAGAYEFG